MNESAANSESDAAHAEVAEDCMKTLEDALLQTLTLAQEPAYTAMSGATSIQSLYTFAMACESVPVVLMARSMQRALLTVLPQSE